MVSMMLFVCFHSLHFSVFFLVGSGGSLHQLLHVFVDGALAVSEVVLKLKDLTVFVVHFLVKFLYSLLEDHIGFSLGMKGSHDLMVFNGPLIMLDMDDLMVLLRFFNLGLKLKNLASHGFHDVLVSLDFNFCFFYLNFPLGRGVSAMAL